MDLVPAELKQLIETTPGLEKAYFVGGCVRDWLAGIEVKDFDIEVFGISYEQLVAALSKRGRTDLVGRSFGVVKYTTPSGHCYDFTIPRKDSKVAPGHKGFEIEFTPGITLEEAASRRDFTINAIMFDPRRREVLDFFGGVADLRNKILRHTSNAFVEDPLRVLRGMQFAGRFNLTVAPETAVLCRAIKDGYNELAVERVREEWFKWASRSVVPSAGLCFLVETGWDEHFPEVAVLRKIPQEPTWHPEGDVFVHTCHCCDALAALPEWRQSDTDSRIVYTLAILAHDFGKAETTRHEVVDGTTRIISPGHEEASLRLAEQFLIRINAPLAIRERVAPLVFNHMFSFRELSDHAVRRLARRLEPETIDGLSLVMIADSMGRPPRPAKVPDSVKRLLAKAHDLNVRQSAPKPILQGRHLIDLGLTPGPAFGEILRAAYEAQLEGSFQDVRGALAWLEKNPPAKPDLER